MSARRKHRKRKLDTPEEIVKVCFLYYQTDTNQAQIARHLGVSDMTIKRVLDEHGADYFSANRNKILEFRRR